MWDESVEKLLQKYCDEAKTRECLHRKAFYRFKKLTTCFQLPVIILSAIAGLRRCSAKDTHTPRSTS